MMTSRGEGQSRPDSGHLGTHVSWASTSCPLPSISPTLSADTVGRSISGELAIIL